MQQQNPNRKQAAALLLKLASASENLAAAQHDIDTVYAGIASLLEIIDGGVKPRTVNDFGVVWDVDQLFADLTEIIDNAKYLPGGYSLGGGGISAPKAAALIMDKYFNS